MKPLSTLILLLILLSLTAVPAGAQEEGPSTNDPAEDATEPAGAKPVALPPAPPELKATLFLRAGGGAAQTRGNFRWDDEVDDRPLDGQVLTSSGSVNQLGIAAWFYPTPGQRFLLLAELYAGANSTKIHYAGPGEELVRKKFINYNVLHLMGGLGHRFWFGQQQRYSMTYFAQAGPGAAVGEVENVALDLSALGGELLAGASIQYHYSTRILFGGMINLGYRAYTNPEQKIDSGWSVKNESAELDMSSAYVSFCALIGYDF